MTKIKFAEYLQRRFDCIFAVMSGFTLWMSHCVAVGMLQDEVHQIGNIWLLLAAYSLVTVGLMYCFRGIKYRGYKNILEYLRETTSNYTDRTPLVYPISRVYLTGILLMAFALSIYDYMSFIQFALWVFLCYIAQVIVIGFAVGIFYSISHKHAKTLSKYYYYRYTSG